MTIKIIERYTWRGIIILKFITTVPLLYLNINFKSWNINAFYNNNLSTRTILFNKEQPSNSNKNGFKNTKSGYGCAVFYFTAPNNQIAVGNWICMT